jgi:enoyl-[acyl-carrier protein] reductase II
VVSEESSAHPEFKKKIVEAKDGDTSLVMKKVVPVRLLRNKFSDEIREMEGRGASSEELMQLLGKGRAMRGMFEGNTEEGELEIGQASAMVDEIMPAGKIVEEIMQEFNEAKQELTKI